MDPYKKLTRRTKYGRIPFVQHNMCFIVRKPYKETKMDKKEDNKPGGPGDRLHGKTVTIKVDGENIQVQTIDGEADVADIIKKAGGKPDTDEIAFMGKDARYKAGDKIKVHGGENFSLYEKGPTTVS